MITKITIKDFGKKYRKEEIKTSRIDNFPEYQHELFNLSSDRFAGLILTLTGNKVKELTEVFGKQDFLYRYEYNNYGWLIESYGCQGLIFSGNKGTSLEIILDDAGNPKGSVKRFFQDYIEFMQNLPE